MNTLSALASAVDVRWAAIQGSVDDVVSFHALTQLRFTQNDIQPEIVKEREGYRTGDRDAVFHVAGKGGVAADRDHAVYRQWHLDRSKLGVLRISRNQRTIRIRQVEENACRNVG